MSVPARTPIRTPTRMPTGRRIRSPASARAPGAMGRAPARLKKTPDAADPLYKTLDEGQKRRLAVLTRHRGPFGGGEDGPRRHFMERGMDRMMERGMDHFHRDRFDRDDGPDRDREGRL